METMMIIAYIVLLSVSIVVLLVTSKLAGVAKEMEDTLADKEARISSLRSEIYFLENTVDCLKERVEILEGDK